LPLWNGALSGGQCGRVWARVVGFQLSS
jgi:hypothetical protein